MVTTFIYHPTSPSLLAVGPWQHGEFATVRNELDPQRHWRTADSLAEASTLALKLEAAPEIILLAQPRPGCDDQVDVERWRTAWPLTRVIVVAGAWCEGELRTGRPLTGVIRLYWHEFAPWWRAALSRLAAGKFPPWSAPVDSPSAARPPTQFDEDPLQRSGFLNPASPPARLVIDALDFATFEALEFALKPAGWQCHWQPRHRPEIWSQSEAARPTAGLWDGAQLNAAEQHDLQEFCTRLATHQASIVALLDFPRPEQMEIAKSCGASILGKPYSISALIECLGAAKHQVTETFATGNPT